MMVQEGSLVHVNFVFPVVGAYSNLADKPVCHLTDEDRPLFSVKQGSMSNISILSIHSLSYDLNPVVFTVKVLTASVNSALSALLLLLFGISLLILLDYCLLFDKVYHNQLHIIVMT